MVGLVSRTIQYFRKLGERGAVIVEFAILAPIFLMLLLGIFEL
jgi:Flp pilus assembly protein TadG